MDQNQIKHLEFIQNIITRMNSNSFQIKKWCVVIVSTIFTIFLVKGTFFILLVSFFPIVLFWFLDAYYLMLERKFRALYDKVRLGNELEIFSMNINPFNKRECWYFKSFFSKTICFFYIVMIIIVVSVFLVQLGR